MRRMVTAMVIAGFVLVAAHGGDLLPYSDPARAADHLDAPTVAADHRVDISDFYVFHARDNAHSVLAMDLNALSTPADTAGLRFAPDALYQFHVDLTGDTVEDYAYQVTFGTPRADGSQPMTVSWASGTQAREHRRGITIGRGSTSTTGTVKAIPLPGAGTAAAGPREDPFFFDLAGAANGGQFTGTDTFAGTNVSAIVLEVPNAWLPGAVRVWASTARPGTDGRMAQLDRMGKPAMNNTFNFADADKERFNQTVPSHDVANFTPAILATELALGQTPEYAQHVADVLLPDVLTYRANDPAGYPNGRALPDDVINATLTLTSNGFLTTDLVDHNDVPFLPFFPYLAGPH